VPALTPRSKKRHGTSMRTVTSFVSCGVMTTVVVKLELEGFEPRALTETLDADAPSKTVTVELVRKRAAPGRLAIVTEPPGATLFLDGKPLSGTSPFEVPELEGGSEHLVRASKEGFLDEAKSVTVRSGETGKLSIVLKARQPETATGTPGPGGSKKPGRELAAVELSSVPAADVFSEGKKLCHTPCTAKLPLGKASLTFIDGKNDLNASRVVTVERSGTRLSVEFKKGKLAANVEPWADVYLGDKKLGTTPLAPRELYEGSYSLKLVNSEIGAMRNVKVQVEAGKTTVLREKLN
jgi:eukaryotic-like serine/threonine-protein kinase